MQKQKDVLITIKTFNIGVSHDWNVKPFFIITLILLTSNSIILLVLIKYQGYIIATTFEVIQVQFSITVLQTIALYFLGGKKKLH